MRLHNLADVIRAAGLPVTEVGGWQGRGGELSRISGIVLHHTAGAARGDYPSLGIVRDGRPGIPGPLSQIGLGRERVYVIAGGRANHAGVGHWPGIIGNLDTIGIEAESTGLGDGGWTAFQKDAYPRLVRALAIAYGVPAARVIAHREWAPERKIDPTGINMNDIRRAVTAPETPAPDPKESFLMALSSEQQTALFNRVMGGVPGQQARQDRRTLDSGDGDALAEMIADVRSVLDGIPHRLNPDGSRALLLDGKDGAFLIDAIADRVVAKLAAAQAKAAVK